MYIYSTLTNLPQKVFRYLLSVSHSFHAKTVPEKQTFLLRFKHEYMSTVLILMIRFYFVSAVEGHKGVKN